MEATGICVRPPRKRKKKKSKKKTDKSLHNIGVEDLDVPVEDQTLFQDAASIVVSEITENILNPLPDSLAEETLSSSQSEETNAKNFYSYGKLEEKTELINATLPFLKDLREKNSDTKLEVVNDSESKLEEVAPIIEISECTTAEIQVKNSKLAIENDLSHQTSQPIIANESENAENGPTPLTRVESDCNMQHTDASELKPLHPSIIVNEYNKLLHASKKAKQEAQEKEAMGSETLKPSVFVGKGRPYSSSLEIGYQWDRTKYNPVLLPDLTKVVYPDLDSAFTKEPSYKFLISQKKEYTIVEEEETLLPSERLPINRLTKPKLKEIIEKHREKAKQIPDCILQDINELNSDKTDINNQTEDAAARDNPVKYVKPKPKPFVDYIKDDGIKKIRIFMNPLVWNPQENQQLVLFEVDSIFYEEFFTDCKTKIGLLKAIIERGDELSKNQIRLESLSKRKWNSKTKEYKLQNSAMLTIYGCPLKWKQKKNKQRVLFKVNGMYHEEEFVNCGSLEGLLEAVMARSESLGRQQSKWKERTLELLAAWSLSFSNNFESLEKVLNENDDRKYDPNEDDFEQPNESLTDTRENAKIYPPPTKNVFATMRKWWKGAFGKKSVQHRESEPTLSQAGRAGSSVVSSSEFNTENDSPISTTESAENELNTFQNLCAVANENNHPFSQDVPKRPNRTTFGNLFKKK